MRFKSINSIIIICLGLQVPGVASEDVHRESLIAQAQKREKNMELAGVFVSDSLLEQYLTGVVSKILKNDQKFMTIKVRVIKDISFNAYAAANGSIYVCSGLLARIDNEAQLAALLGHEITHISNDHLALALLNAKKSASSNARVQIGLELFLGSLANTIGNISLRTAITGYSRDLEREADSIGLIRMACAGYAPIQFRNLFLKLKKAIEEEGIDQPFFFSTHPAISERIDNFYSLTGKDTSKSSLGDINTAEFLLAIKNVLAIDGSMRLGRGALDIAEIDFTRVLEINSCDVNALLRLGDIARLRYAPQKSDDAFRWYYMAKSCDCDGGESFKSLGFYYFKFSKPDSASVYLSKFNESNPGNPCSNIIRNYIHQCDR